MMRDQSVNMSFLADRAKVKPSATVNVLDQVKELKRAGEDVISLSAWKILRSLSTDSQRQQP